MTSSAYERRAFMGGAAATTITAALTTTSLTITLASGTGWDTSASLPFYAVIDRGGAHEEKIRCTGVSGTSVTLTNTGDRGCDGTVAQAHDAGETIEVCLVAIDLDEANQAVVQTLDRYNAKGDLVAATAAHTTTTLTVGSNEKFLLADSTTASGLKWGVIPDGAIDTQAKLGAAVVGTTQIIASNVTTAKIADSNVTTAKIADINVTAAKLAPGLIADRALFASPIGPTVSSATEPSTPYAGMQWWDTATSRLKVYDGTYWRLVAGKQLSCTMALTTNPTSLSSTNYISVSHTEVLDYDLMHDPTNSTVDKYITIPDIDITQVAFWLRVSVSARFGTESASTRRGIGIHVNATTPLTSASTISNDFITAEQTSTSALRLIGSETVLVAKGYVITPAYYTSTGSCTLVESRVQCEFAGYAG